MKQRIISIFIIFLMLFTTIGMAAVNEDASIRIDSLKYEPYPVEPGDFFTIWIKAENYGQTTANDFTFKFIEQYPFELHKSEDTVKNLGRVGAFEQVVMQYKVYVDEDVTPGNHELKFEYTTNGRTWITKELSILVRSTNSVLSVDKIKNPILKSSEEDTLVFTLKNVQKSDLKNIQLQLDTSSQVVGTSIEEFPFGIIDSGKSKVIDELKAGKSEEISFKLKAESKAVSGIYKVPVTITYKDTLDNEYTLNEVASVIIRNEPELDLLIESADINSLKPTGDVILKVINKGLGNAEFLNLKIEDSENYDLLSQNNEFYIGELESDDFDSIEFKIHVKNLESNTIKVTASYYDVNNEYQELKEDLSLKVIDAELLNGKKSYTGTIVVLLILVVVGFFIYRRRKNKNKK